MTPRCRHARSIFPSDSPTTDPLSRFCVYEIVEATPPPRINLTRTLRQSLFPPKLAQIISRIQRHYVLLAGVLFILAQVVTSIMLVVEVSLGRVLGVASFCLQMPLLVLSVSSLCTDMILELLQTFEFWFFTFANTASTVVMAVYLGDSRAMAMLAAWLGVEYNICIDAALRGFRLTVVVLAVGIACQCFTLTVITLGIVPSVHQFKIANYGAKTVTSDDFLVNTISTVVFLLARSLFRRVLMLRNHRKHLKDSLTTSRSIQFVRCVSYRCAVQLRVVPLPGNSDPTVIVPQGPIRFVAVDRTFDSRETLCCGRNLSMIRVPTWLQLAFHAVGATGLSLTGLLFLILNYVRPYPFIARVCAIAAPVVSGVYCAVCMSLYHPALLKKLCYSVDFAFMLAQFCFAHVCAAYLFQWDDRTFLLIASLGWVLFLLTVDAFTPAARDRIGFRLVFLVPLLLLSITAHVLIALEVTRDVSPWGLRDDSMFHVTAFGYALELHVKPAFFNRVWMLVCWELRMLWRMLRASSHDLVVIHGAVDLDVGTLRRRMAVSVVAGEVRSLAQIQPAPRNTGSVGRRDYTPAVRTEAIAC